MKLPAPLLPIEALGLAQLNMCFLEITVWIPTADDQFGICLQPKT